RAWSTAVRVSCSVLVRVPLGWTTDNDMGALANPLEKAEKRNYSGKQTVEFRCPDGSADIYQLMSGLIVACQYGLENPDSSKIAEKTYVDVNIFDDANKNRVAMLNQLPSSCVESSEQLDRQRAIYEANGVFSPNAIDGVISALKAFDDKTLRADLANDSEKMMKVVKKYFHCG
ncbi:MAG: glutamine synthetase, partial [Rikenellaceae bacterium]